MSVAEYLEKHRLSQRLEEAINAAVRAKADDPSLFVANYLRRMSPPTVTGMAARQIFDSRGNPTVEVDLQTTRGTFRASVPSGNTTGIHSAVELRDVDVTSYLGKGVSGAVDNINMKIAPAVLGRDARGQAEIDRLMREDLDGTENKSNLGANAILAVSMAICKAGAAEAEVPLYRYIADLAGVSRLILPVPAFSVISGGRHAGNRLAFQEFMIMPIGAESFREAMRMGTETYHHLKTTILEKYGLEACNVGDEGGFAPPIDSAFEALDLIKDAIRRAGFTGKIKIAIDAASSEFYTVDRKYDLDFKNPKNDGSQKKSGAEMTNLYKSFCLDYPVVSIEDPFDQDDFDNTRALTALNLCQVVGDALLASNAKRVAQAVEAKAGNCLLLKLTHTGSLSEALLALQSARAGGWAVVASHRSGETDETFLSDMAVGLATGQIKAGAPCRGERLAKYNQLLRIEEELGEKAVYAGEQWRPKP